jgi:hypothetical protein
MIDTDNSVLFLKPLIDSCLQISIKKLYPDQCSI